MTEIARRRVTAGSGAGSAWGQGGQADTDHRRQGKSAAFGPAHVVGFIEHFRGYINSPCWRFARILQSFQCPERRRSLRELRSPP